MKSMIRQLKRFAKWYLQKASETYAWTPSCTIPYVKVNNEEKEEEKSSDE